MIRKKLGAFTRRSRFHIPVWLLILLLGGTTILVAAASNVSPTNQWIDIYSTHSVFDGHPLQTGDYVAVFDPSGVQCGEFTVHTESYYGLMPCYGDDSDTPEDEGAVAGDVLHFTINGFEATATAITHNGESLTPETAVIWNQHGERWQVDLSASGAVQDLTLNIVSTGVELSWDDVGGPADHYEVWRSGTPYFDPGDAGAQRIANNIPANPNAKIVYTDAADHLGDPDTNDYYLVRTIYDNGNASPASNATAAFDFALTPPQAE